MKKFKLLIMAVKIEVKWVLIKILKKTKACLNTSIEKINNKEKLLKHDVHTEGINYENLSGYRDAA